MSDAMGRNNDSNTAAVEPDAEIERLKGDIRREHEMYLRAVADFDNFRRRIERDQDKTAASGKREIIRSLLDVLDGFDRALPYIAGSTSSVVEGVQAIHRRLLDLLDAQKVEVIKTIGEPFDPASHEAIGAVESDDYPPGFVASEVQRGYRLGDELLRPARVQVVR
jgi:molecular chaperone GrpE